MAQTSFYNHVFSFFYSTCLTFSPRLLLFCAFMSSCSPLNSRSKWTWICLHLFLWQVSLDVWVFKVSLQLVLCTVSASMSAYGSANVTHAFGTLCCHLCAIVMPGERWRSKGYIRPCCSHFPSTLFFTFIFVCRFLSHSSPHACAVRWPFLFCQLIPQFSLIVFIHPQMLNFTTLEKSWGCSPNGC